MASAIAPSSQVNGTHRPSSHDLRKGVKYLVDTASNLQSIPSEYILPLPVCPPSVCDASLPVIDLTGLDGSMEQRASTVQALSSACAEWGFFRIVNHGVKISLMEEMMRMIEEFFCLPLEEKMKYASDDVMHPVRYGTSLTTLAKHTLHWRDYLKVYGHPLEKSFHLWPDKPSNYREVAKEYVDEVLQLALKLMGALSEGLGLDRDYIEKSLRGGTQIINSNYYPPCPEPHRTLGLPAHSDHGGITILMENDVDGLQVRYNDNWIQVPHVPGSYIVNLGDCIEILSNGRYKSMEHRSVVNEQRTRISIAANLAPELTAIVAPASQLLDEKNALKYTPIIYKDYMRRQQNSVVREKHSLQALMRNS